MIFIHNIISAYKVKAFQPIYSLFLSVIAIFIFIEWY